MLLFDREQRIQQVARRERCPAGDDGVQVQRLIEIDRAVDGFGFGFDEIGNGDVGENAGQTIYREGDRGASVSEVAAQRDCGEPGRARYCSIHLTGRTSPPVLSPPSRRPSRSVLPAAACSKKRRCSSVSPRMTSSIVRCRACVSDATIGRHLSTNACALSRSWAITEFCAATPLPLTVMSGSAMSSSFTSDCPCAVATSSTASATQVTCISSRAMTYW